MDGFRAQIAVFLAAHNWPFWLSRCARARGAPVACSERCGVACGRCWWSAQALPLRQGKPVGRARHHGSRLEDAISSPEPPDGSGRSRRRPGGRPRWRQAAPLNRGLRRRREPRSQGGNDHYLRHKRSDDRPSAAAPVMRERWRPAAVSHSGRPPVCVPGLSA